MIVLYFFILQYLIIFIFRIHFHFLIWFYRYLQEIGYTDTIIDVRSNRVRSLLGLNNNAESDEVITPALNGNDQSGKRTSETQGRLISAKKVEVNKWFKFKFKSIHIASSKNAFKENHSYGFLSLKHRLLT